MVSRQPFELLSSFPLLLSKWTVYKLYWSIRGVKAEIKKLPEHKNVLFVLSEQYLSYATWPLLRVYFSFESSRKEKKKNPTIFKPHFPVWSWSFSIIALSFRGVDTEHSIDHFTRSDHKKSSLQWSFTFAPGMVSKLKKTRHIESWLSSSLLSPAEPIAISMQFVYNVGWSFHAAEIQLMPELQNDFWNKPADQCHQAYCFGFWLIVAIMCVHSAWDLTTTNHSFKCHCWSLSKTHGSSFCHLGLVVWVSVCVCVWRCIKRGIAFVTLLWKHHLSRFLYDPVSEVDIWRKTYKEELTVPTDVTKQQPWHLWDKTNNMSQIYFMRWHTLFLDYFTT